MRGRDFVTEARNGIQDGRSDPFSENIDSYVRISGPADLDPRNTRFSPLLTRYFRRAGIEGRRRLIEFIAAIQSDEN